MAKNVDEKFHFLEPQDIDTLMKNRIANANKGRQKVPWPENELQLRRYVIYQYCLEQGLSKRRCAEQICDRWGICMATAYNYIKEAFEDFSKFAADQAPAMKERHMERLESLLSDALMDHNGDLAAKMLDQIAKCNGFYVDKKELSVKDNHIEISFE